MGIFKYFVTILVSRSGFTWRRTRLRSTSTTGTSREEEEEELLSICSHRGTLHSLILQPLGDQKYQRMLPERKHRGSPDGTLGIFCNFWESSQCTPAAPSKTAQLPLRNFLHALASHSLSRWAYKTYCTGRSGRQASRSATHRGLAKPLLTTSNPA